MRAEVLLEGGRVYTMDAQRPRARAVAIANGRITALDDDAQALRGSSTRVIELNGRAVVPGFVDAHVHFGEFALAREQVNLDAAPTLDRGLDLLRDRHTQLAAGVWLRGRGWDRNRWGRLPTAADLDHAIGERCAVLSSHDGHSLWLSTAAMRTLGLNAQTPTPSGGVIERDEHGNPTGVFFENAQDVVRTNLPEITDDEARAAIKRALPVAAAAGLTGLHNLEGGRSQRAFEALEKSGELTLRVHHGIPRAKLSSARDLGLRTGAGSELVKIGPVKLFSDGALGSRTAYMLEPYEGRDDGYRGVSTLHPAALVHDLRLAAEAGLDVAVHAIGDAAVRTVLDAFEWAREQQGILLDRRLRIEHAQLTDPADIPRFAKLGVIASMQPIHAIADWRTANAHWGGRARHAYAWRELLNAGAQLAFGTDAPVERIEPLLSLRAAVTRTDPNGEPSGGWYPEQCLSLEEAVRAYTAGSACAEGVSDRRGSISVGKDADIAVLSNDPFQRDVRALEETCVELTMVGGNVVYTGLGS